jgi:hypothetical protein
MEVEHVVVTVGDDEGVREYERVINEAYEGPKESEEPSISTGMLSTVTEMPEVSHGPKDGSCFRKPTSESEVQSPTMT